MASDSQPTSEATASSPPASLPGPSGLLTVLLGLASGGTSYLFHQRVLGGIAHVQDEIAYRWQGQIFAGLDLTAPRPPFDAVFITSFQKVLDDRIYAIFPPGWPWLLALGHWLRLEAVLPMLLSGLNVLLLARLARALDAWQPMKTGLAQDSSPLEPCAPTCRRAGGPETARTMHGRVPILAAGLALLSPAWWVMGGTFMAHTFCLTLVLLFLHAQVSSLQHSGRGAALILGTSCGWLVATRPLDAVAVCGPALLWLGWRWLKGRWSTHSMLGAALPALLLLGGLLGHNAALTGDPLVFPQNTYFATPPDGLLGELAAQLEHEQDTETPYRFTATCNHLGLSADQGCGSTWGSLGHSPQKAAKNLLANLVAFDRNLFGGVGSLLLILPGLWFWRTRLPVLGPPLLLFPLLYALYWYHGLAYGARFLHPLLAPALILVAGGLDGMLRWLEARSPRWRPGLVALLVLAAIMARGSSYLVTLRAEYEESYWCVNDRVREVTATRIDAPALVLIGHTGIVVKPTPLSSLPEAPLRCNNFLRAGGSLQHNDPGLERAVLYGYLPEKREQVEAIRRHFSDRRIYLYVLESERGREELLELTAGGLRAVYEGRVPIAPGL